MSWLANIASLITGGAASHAAPGAEQLLIEVDGALFLRKPQADRAHANAQPECIYPHATLAVQRAPTAQHLFHLLVTRVYDEDAVESDEDDEDEQHASEKRFVLTPTMRLHTSATPDGLACVRWADPVSGDPARSAADVFEFVVPHAPKSATFKVLRMTLLQCLYERKYMRSHEAATDAELDAMEWVPSAKQETVAKSAPAKQQQQSRQSQRDRTPTRARSVTPTRNSRGAAPAESAPAAAASLYHALPPPPPLPAHVTSLALELDAELFLYILPHRMPAEGEFQLVDGTCTVQLWTTEPGSAKKGKAKAKAHQPEAWLVVESSARGALVRQPLTDAMNHVFWPEDCAMIWNCFVERAAPRGATVQECLSLSVALPSDAEFREFRRAFVAAHVDATLGDAMAGMALGEDDMLYLEQQATDAGHMDVDEPYEDEDKARGESDEEEEEEEEPADEPAYSEDDGEESQPDSGASNSALTTGRSRTYVVRGSSIGVFGYTHKGGIKFNTMVNKVSFNRQALSPDKVLLHEGEHKMVLTDARDKSNVYELDLAAEKVVNKWSLGGRQVLDMAARAKSAQLAGSADPTFLGVSQNGVFVVDPRLASGVAGALDDADTVDASNSYTYSKNMSLSAVASSADGHVAVGSEKGELRLFSKTAQRATTALQGAGAPIRHLDVSLDGRYVLATTRNALLLFDVKLTTAAGKPTTAFTTRMPANARPDAIRLTLSPNDVAKMGAAAHAVEFKQAYFNVSASGETGIVSSTGPYVVTWLLADVLQGRRDKCKVKRYEDEVVGDQFRFGDAERIVLALPNDVKTVARSRLGRL